jgi:lipoprotein
MRKILNIALVAMAVLLISCKKDDDNEIISRLAGTWNIEKIVVEGEEKTGLCYELSSYSFTDKEYIANFYSYNKENRKCVMDSFEKGTFELSEGVIGLKPVKGDALYFKVSFLDGKLMLSNPKGTSYVKLSKK